MSRAGYFEGDNDWGQIRWRGQVASATRGRRGQKLLKDLLAALDAMADKRLISHDLVKDGEFCALGALGASKGLPIESLNPEDYDKVAETFGVAAPLVREIEYMNDEAFWESESPEHRWIRMREWVASQIKEG